MLMKVGAFHLGPQKTATTWLYRALKQHPEICAPRYHSIHYFDMRHHHGDEWYRQQFSCTDYARIAVDLTPSYSRSALALRRIAAYRPDAKLVICVRSPIERAFSHYWHEKKKKRHNYKFCEALSNYDLFADWIVPGFYDELLTEILSVFDRSQVLVQDFDLLKSNPMQFLKECLTFLNVDAEFMPNNIDTRVNIARPVKPIWLKGLEKLVPRGAINVGQRIIGGPIEDYLAERSAGHKVETIGNVETNVIRELESIYRPHIARLNEMLGTSFRVL